MRSTPNALVGSVVVEVSVAAVAADIVLERPALPQVSGEEPPVVAGHVLGNGSFGPGAAGSCAETNEAHFLAADGCGSARNLSKPLNNDGHVSDDDVALAVGSFGPDGADATVGFSSSCPTDVSDEESECYDTDGWDDDYDIPYAMPAATHGKTYEAEPEGPMAHEVAQQRRAADDFAKSFLDGGRRVTHRVIWHMFDKWVCKRRPGRKSVRPDGDEFVRSDTFGMTGDWHKHGDARFAASTSTTRYPCVSLTGI